MGGGWDPGRRRCHLGQHLERRLARCRALAGGSAFVATAHRLPGPRPDRQPERSLRLEQHLLGRRYLFEPHLESPGDRLLAPAGPRLFHDGAVGLQALRLPPSSPVNGIGPVFACNSFADQAEDRTLALRAPLGRDSLPDGPPLTGGRSFGGLHSRAHLAAPMAVWIAAQWRTRSGSAAANCFNGVSMG